MVRVSPGQRRALQRWYIESHRRLMIRAATTRATWACDQLDDDVPIRQVPAPASTTPREQRKGRYGRA